MSRNGCDKSKKWICITTLATQKKLFASMCVLGFILTSIFQILPYRREPEERKRTLDLVPCHFNMMPVSDIFQPVDYFTDQLYVYSAYTDTLDGTHYIRILGIALTIRTEEPMLTCTIKYAEGMCFRVQADIFNVQEHHEEKYTATYILCEYHNNMTPISVSLKMEPFNHHQYNHLAVHQYKGRIQHQFTLCLPPIHNNFSNVNELVEFFAVNQEFGAERFVVYVDSMSNYVAGILRLFTDIGFVTTIKFHLPAVLSNDTHYHGQMLAMNDCLYRNRHKTRFIINSDLDEFIVPRTTRKWAPLLNFLGQQNPMAASFNARSFIFCVIFDSHPGYFLQRKAAEKFHSMTMLKTNRTVLPHPKDVREKYIYDPLLVTTAGIHFVWTFRDGGEAIYMDPDVCSLNHYKYILVGTGIEGVNETFTIDDHMHTFQDGIISNMNYLWRKINNAKILS